MDRETYTSKKKNLREGRKKWGTLRVIFVVVVVVDVCMCSENTAEKIEGVRQTIRIL